MRKPGGGGRLLAAQPGSPRGRAARAVAEGAAETGMGGDEASRGRIEFERGGAAVRVGIVRGAAERRPLVGLVIPDQPYATGWARKRAHTVMLARCDAPVGHLVARPAEAHVTEAFRQLE